MSGFFHKIMRGLLDLRGWVYVLSLLVPLVVYNLVLKSVGVVAQEEVDGSFEALALIRSDLLFNAGYAALWIGLFSMARSGVPRGIVVALFHAASLLVVTISTTAYQYFQATGSTLDYIVVVFYLGTLGEIKDIIASEAPWYVWILLAAVLLYALLGPWIVTRIVTRYAGHRDARLGTQRNPGGVAGFSRLGAGLCMVSVGLVSFSLVPGAADANQASSLSPPVNVLITGVRSPTAGELTTETASRLAVSLKDARLEATPRTEKRNVVLIHLESVRSRSTDPYNPDANTTPFLAKLADRSLLVERAYTTTPHTSKALTSLNCGIYPHPETAIHESELGGVPVRCLPDLLEEQGYRSMVFQSAIGKFEDRPQLVENFGYGGFIGVEDMDKSGFERAGYLGYEDDIMLEPSRKWLEENGDKGPFLTSYVTITPHHEWLAPDRYGLRDYGVEDRFNRYLNTVHYVDFFVKNLIQQYKDLGLYEDTIFIIYGDHGEGFAEHGVRGHDNVIHEEGLRVPLIIHDPQRWQDGKRISADYPTNHMDIPPTILDLLNYRLVNGEYPGASVVDEPNERTLYFNCRPDLLCMASTKGYEKYIYHYGKQPEEFYNLKKDPLEKNNLADEMPDKELDERRKELIEWRARSAAIFDEAPEKTGAG